MLALMSNLWKNDLKKTLIMTYPHDFVDMLAHTKKYAQMKDAIMQEEVPTTFLLGGGEKM